MVTYKKPKRGSITPPPPIVPRWGYDFSRASEGHDFAQKKLHAICYILRSFWSFIYWFELLLGQFWWFSEVLTKTGNLRWRIQDGRHFGNNDLITHIMWCDQVMLRTSKERFLDVLSKFRCRSLNFLGVKKAAFCASSKLGNKKSPSWIGLRMDPVTVKSGIFSNF